MVSLFACFSILMLSVPTVIAADKAPKKFSFNRTLEKPTKVAFLFSFLNLKVNKNNSSNKTSDDKSGQKIKITGGKLVNKVVKDD